MAINPQAFNLRQFAQPGVSNRPMFRNAATPTAAQPIVPPQIDRSRSGIIGPLEKYLAENSIDPNIISGGEGDQTLAGGGGVRFAAPPPDVAAQPIVPPGVAPPVSDMRATAPHISPGVAPLAPPPETIQEPIVEEPTTPFGLDPAKDKADIEVLKRLADEATTSAVETGSITQGEGVVAAGEGSGQVDALNNLDTLQGQLKLLGLEKKYTEEDYNKKAKSILGLDQDEEDVPVWAAPLFLFGLELLKGEGPGDLLGDIGAAGAKAFPVLGAEVARRRKDRKDIGALAYQLQTADVAARTAAAKNVWERQKFYIEHNLNQRKALDESFTKMLDRYTKNYDGEQIAEFTFAMSDVLDTMGPVVGETINAASGRPYTQQEVLNWQVATLQSPMSRNLIAAAAQRESGLQPNIKLDSIDLPPDQGGGKMWYSPDAVWKYAKKNNKTQSQVMSEMVANPADYPNLVISQTKDFSNLDIKFQSIGGGFSQWVSVDKTKYDPENPDAAYTLLGEKVRTDRPDIKPFEYMDSQGKSHKVFIDFDALQDKNITDIRQAVNDPTITIYGAEDFSKFASGLSIETIYTENNKKAKAIFNKNAAMEFLQTPEGSQYKTIKDLLADKTNLTSLEEKGIITRLPGEIASGDVERVAKISPDGSIVLIDAPAGGSGELIAGLESAVAQKDHTAVRGALIQLHGVAYEIENILQANPNLMATRGTDWLGSLASALRLAKMPFNAGKTNQYFSQLKSAKDRSGVARDQSVIDSVQNALSDSSFEKWGITNKAERQRIRSFLTEAAFALASAREGGKLTDNDVKAAFATLGWDGTSWTGTPEEMMTGLESAATSQTNNYLAKYATFMTDETLATGETIGIFENILREHYKSLGTGTRKTTELGRRINAALEAAPGETAEEKWANIPEGTFFRFDVRTGSKIPSLIEQQAAVGEQSPVITANVGRDNLILYNRKAIVNGQIEIPTSIKGNDMATVLNAFKSDTDILVPPTSLDVYYQGLVDENILSKTTSNTGEVDYTLNPLKAGDEATRRLMAEINAFEEWAKINLWK
jgi:hypothetical protein